MKRLPLFLIAGAALTGSAALFAQQVTTDAAPGSGAEPFPWPDFIEADPLPGGYRMTMIFESMDIPGMSGAAKDQPGMGGMPGMEEPMVDYMCHTGDFERLNVLEEITGGSGDCEASPITRDGENFGLSVACTTQSGEQIDVRATGSGNAEGIDAQIAMRIKEQSMGRMNMTMRVSIQRIGDCSAIPESERPENYVEPIYLEESVSEEVMETE